MTIRDKNLIGAAGEHLVLSRLLSKEILAGTVNDGDRIMLDYFEETGLVFRPVE